MKRFLLLLLLLAYGTGRAEYWESPYDTPSLCKENHPGCQTLRTVMMGSFSLP